MTDQKFRQGLGFSLFLAALAFSVLFYAFESSQGTNMLQWVITGLEQITFGVFTIAIALIFIDPLINQFQRKAASEEETRRLKEDLLAKLRSRINGVAAQATEELQRHGWTRDGSLKQINLSNANLRQASLQGAKLSDGTFEGTNFHEADLRQTDLQEAALDEADCRGADLTGANLRYAALESTNLEGAFLDHVDLRGAYLLNANLKNATLFGVTLGWGVRCEDSITFPPAIFDEETTLPDGTMWTSTTDMHRFTDPNHPDYYVVDLARRVSYLK